MATVMSWGQDSESPPHNPRRQPHPRRPHLPSEFPQASQQQTTQQWNMPGVGHMPPVDPLASAPGQSPHPPPWPAPAGAGQHHHLRGTGEPPGLTVRHPPQQRQDQDTQHHQSMQTNLCQLNNCAFCAKLYLSQPPRNRERNTLGGRLYPISPVGSNSLWADASPFFGLFTEPDAHLTYCVSPARYAHGRVRRPSCTQPPNVLSYCTQTNSGWNLIQRGGGTGPEKPRQPGFSRLVGWSFGRVVVWSLHMPVPVRRPE